jgi:adenine-specific DNA-methyltransferase
MFSIHNRRYTGSKLKLTEWITDLINSHCQGDSFCEIFAGTSVITSKMIGKMKRLIINDTLRANHVIYQAFYGEGKYDVKKLKEFSFKVNYLTDFISDFFTCHYADKYFSLRDCQKIDTIRNMIEKEELTPKEYSILLASLIYSMDRCANTVGHYDAYIKKKSVQDRFVFELIKPFKLENVACEIYQEDANQLAKKITADIVYIDPPYNSRQYCQFYHIYETIVNWDKPKLYGVALKPRGKCLSDYCRVNARNVFSDLINNLSCQYIVVSYNNTYKSKSNSSKNKISLEHIESVLKQKGETQMFSTNHKFFNTGKTDFDDHREFIFIVRVRNGS